MLYVVCALWLEFFSKRLQPELVCGIQHVCTSLEVSLEVSRPVSLCMLKAQLSENMEFAEGRLLLWHLFSASATNSQP